MRTAVSLGLSGLLGLAALAGCKKPAPSAAPELTAAKSEAKVHVEAVPIVEQAMPELLTLTGQLRASQESDVAADANGKVAATLVERGQRVKQGETLAILDARGASITASAAAAQSNLAQAQLEQAKKECDRVESLFKTGAISQAEYDRTTSQCKTTQFSVAAAQAQQQNAQKIVGDSVIRAPFSGMIGERYVNVGQYVQPNTRIASLYTPDPLRLELTVPEANVSGLKPEQAVVFNVSAFGDAKFTGTVKFISPNVRPTTRDLVIEAFCPNTDGKLKPGMFAVAKLETAEKPQLAVPSNAIVKEGETTKTFVVVDKHINERIVQLGGDKDGMTSVLVGLKAGESVVVSPSPDVRDGAPVQ